MINKSVLQTTSLVLGTTLLLFSTTALSATLEASRVRVIDGDTLEVIPKNRQSERIRLLGIDAPESSQVYGKEATKTLEKCVASGKVKIQYRERDKYSRILGKVWSNGVDCNLYQVKIGSAWHYKYFQNQQPPADRTVYSKAEDDAKRSKLGLWAYPNAMNPYDYRQKNK